MRRKISTIIEKYDDKVKSAYRELTKMRAISDKIATFIIRDIGLQTFPK